MAEVSLREMCLTDLDDVMRNEVRSYAFPWTRGTFRDCLRASYECWVLMSGETIVGHGVLSAAAGEAHLLNVCVSRDRQGDGLGRVLVEHMIEVAERRHAEVVFLEVRPSNVVACKLYDSLGFNEIGRRRNYYPAHDGHEDALVLALQIAVPT